MNLCSCVSLLSIHVSLLSLSLPLCLPASHSSFLYVSVPMSVSLSLYHFVHLSLYPSVSVLSASKSFQTGLRQRRLVIFSIFVIILFVLSILLLIVSQFGACIQLFQFNLLIIFKLQIGQQGMRHVRFHSAKNIKNGEEERVR